MKIEKQEFEKKKKEIKKVLGVIFSPNHWSKFVNPFFIRM